MTDTYEYSLTEPPANEVLDRQTQHQLSRNFAQGTHNNYELTDVQFNEISTIVFGSGSAYTGDWVPGRPVTVNGETLLWLKRRGDHVRIVTTVHS